MFASKSLKPASSISVSGRSARSALRSMCTLRPVFGSTKVGQTKRAGLIVVPRSTEPETPAETTAQDTILESDSISAQKKANAERLRAAEKFMVVGAGNATCKGCGYEYKPEVGDPDFPIPKGTKFESLPDDYSCPICGANKDKFQSRVKVVAGFAENQKYGLGTNSMTGEQKLGLIYGALGFFFACFLAGYALQ